MRPDRSLVRTRGLPEGNPGQDPGDAADLPSIRIDAGNEAAWCGERRLELTPRVFAVLRHLVEHPNRLITRDDLLARVWRDTIVSDAALASCIRDLRRALGDSSDMPRYLETVHRRGFRFIGPIAVPAAALEQGRTDAARGLLSSIYTSFTKGHDTADLREAKSLLEPPDGRPASQLPRDSGQRGSARPRTRRTR